MVADWTLALPFSREIVSLDVLEHPRQDFQAALGLIASGPSQVMDVHRRDKDRKRGKARGRN